MPDLESDFKKLAADATQMAQENARLRNINTQMLAALQYVLPLLQEGLPATVNFDWTKGRLHLRAGRRVVEGKLI